MPIQGPGSENIAKSSEEAFFFVEESAFHANKHRELGLVPHDKLVDYLFTQMHVEEKWKYDAASSKPTLKKQMDVRISQPQGAEDKGLWRSTYDTLVSALPADMQAQLQKEQTLPFMERDAEYTALNNTLIAAAKAMQWLEQAVIPPASNTPAAMQSELYGASPSVAASTILSDASTVFSLVNSHLIDIGPNDPEFDYVSKFVQDLEESRKEFQEILQDLRKKEVPKDARKRLVYLTSDLDRLNTSFQSRRANTLNIVGTTINTMAQTTRALLSSHASPQLHLNLSFATLGLDKPESEIGFVGPALSSVIDEASRAALTTIPSGSDVTLKEMESLKSDLIDFGEEDRQ